MEYSCFRNYILAYIQINLKILIHVTKPNLYNKPHQPTLSSADKQTDLEVLYAMVQSGSNASKSSSNKDQA